MSFAETPELFELVSSDHYKKLQAVIDGGKGEKSPEAKAALKSCFSSLMNQPTTLIQKNLSTLAERYALQCK